MTHDNLPSFSIDLNAVRPNGEVGTLLTSAVDWVTPGSPAYVFDQEDPEVLYGAVVLDVQDDWIGLSVDLSRPWRWKDS